MGRIKRALDSQLVSDIWAYIVTQIYLIREQC